MPQRYSDAELKSLSRSLLTDESRALLKMQPPDDVTKYGGTRRLKRAVSIAREEAVEMESATEVKEDRFGDRDAVLPLSKIDAVQERARKKRRAALLEP